MVKRRQRGSGRTLNIPKVLEPGVIPGPTHNGGVTVGEACVGAHCSIPVTPTVANYVNKNLMSASPAPKGNVMYPGTNRLGNNSQNMPGISDYVGTALNHGPFKIQCAGGDVFTKITNPETGRKISIYGKKGQTILSRYLSFMSGGGCTSDTDCKDGTICNSLTGRCVKKTGKSGKEEMARRAGKAAPAAAAAAPVRAAAPAKPKPMLKEVKNASGVKSTRLSARTYYDKYGPNCVGDRCNVRQDGTYKCLLIKKNGSPYWAKKSKSGAGQDSCENWSSRCQEATHMGGYY